MFRLNIEKSFFYTAGRKYGWETTHDVRGVGINTEILESYEEIEIVVDDVLYYLNCDVAIIFIRRFKSIETHGDTKVAIVSKSILEELKSLKEVKKEIKKEVVEKQVLQSRLF